MSNTIVTSDEPNTRCNQNVQRKRTWIPFPCHLRPSRWSPFAAIYFPSANTPLPVPIHLSQCQYTSPSANTPLPGLLPIHFPSANTPLPVLLPIHLSQCQYTSPRAPANTPLPGLLPIHLSQCQCTSPRAPATLGTLPGSPVLLWCAGRVPIMLTSFFSTIVAPHYPYSPDLAPCDFFLFLKMKFKLKGCYFDTVEEVQGVIYLCKRWI